MTGYFSKLTLSSSILELVQFWYSLLYVCYLCSHERYKRSEYTSLCYFERRFRFLQSQFMNRDALGGIYNIYTFITLGYFRYRRLL